VGDLRGLNALLILRIYELTNFKERACRQSDNAIRQSVNSSIRKCP
jgi:hypothetical protein